MTSINNGSPDFRTCLHPCIILIIFSSGRVPTCPAGLVYCCGYKYGVIGQFWWALHHLIMHINAYLLARTTDT